MVILIGTGFFACDKTWFFEEYQNLTDAEWHKDSVIRFQFPVTDTLQSYNLLLGVRNKTTYKYRNLWLFVEISHPNSQAMKDTFNILLAKPSGEWLGEGLGKIKSRQAMFLRNFYFPVSGNYTINIRHGMREKVLNGIHDIGFRVEKVK